MKSRTGKIIFINTHPIQYFAPLYAYCNEQNLPVEVWYLSDESIKGSKDVQFGQNIKWDIPLLSGYNFRFFKNNSWKPSIYNGFFGVINLGIIKALFKEPKSVVIVHGWAHFSQILAILASKLTGHKVCLRGETPLKQEKKSSPLKLLIRRLFLTQFMFRFVNKFLYIGKQNKDFYQFYGVKKEDLVFIPYTVDNCRFTQNYLELLPEKQKLKHELSIPADHFVIVYSGKYISKKRPLDLLKAFHLLNNTNISLVMIGEGELRKEMQHFISENNLQNVYLTGFINQTVISRYYVVGDVFVMCSQEGETWGLSVNEAMNFSLPLVVSDMVGCTDDLIKTGENGFTYPCGDVSELRNALEGLILDRPFSQKLGQKSKEKIKEFSYQVIKENLQTLL